jgi:hypothetical protein
MKYYKTSKGYYYKLYQNGVKIRISSNEFFKKMNNFKKLKGGNKFEVGDLVECLDPKCISRIKKFRKNQNFFVVTEIIDDDTLKIARITREYYNNHKNNLLSNNELKTIDIHQNKLRKYKLPKKEIKLTEFDGDYSLNTYVLVSHGDESQHKPNILLRKGQKVILVCEPFCGFRYRRSKKERFKDKITWNIILNSKTPIQFFKKILNEKYISEQLCVFEDNVTDIKLTPHPDKFESKYSRHGLYKIPLVYNIDKDKKKKFLEKRLHKKNIHILNKNLNKESHHDISTYRPYVTIKSEHKYDRRRNIKNLYLSDVIRHLREDNINREFTLFMFTCR